jgi:integrase
MSDEGILSIGPNRWRVRAQARDGSTGKKISRSATVNGSKREAKVVLARLRSELDKEGARPKRIRFDDYATSWLAARIGRLKASTKAKYAITLDLHILPVLGDRYVDALRPSDVERLLAQSKLAGNTKLNMLRLLRTIAKDAQAEGVTPIYFCNRVAPPKVNKTRGNLLTAQQVASLFTRVPSKWLPLIMATVYTGLRWGEVSALRWTDIDRGAGVIYVRRGNWRGSIVPTKNEGSERTVPLLPELAEILGSGKRGWVFPTRKGALHRGTPLRRVLTESCAAAGIPRVTTHGLRRTFNNLSRQVADRQVVKAIMGHATDAMHEHYSEVGVDEKQAAQAAVKNMVDLAGTRTNSGATDA